MMAQAGIRAAQIFIAIIGALVLAACNGGGSAPAPLLPVAPPAAVQTWGIAANGIALRASARFAGAIDSLIWNGREFIDSADHGRELQSAVAFDGRGECYNPTEAGSARDAGGPSSTSKIASISAAGTTLNSKTVMAYWLAPGQTSPACQSGATSAAALSDYSLSKTVSIDGNAISHAVSYGVPRVHQSAVFEALTAYLPPAYSMFWTYDPAGDVLAPLSDGPGEQALPVIIATPDGIAALGVYGRRAAGTRGPTYGRWRFSIERVVKWNCVFRKTTVEIGNHAFRCFSIVGTRDAVRQTIKRLASQ